MNLTARHWLKPNNPETTGLVVAHTVTTVKDGMTCFLNPTGKAVELQQGLHMGDFYSLGKYNCMPLGYSTRVDSVLTHPAALPVTLEDSPITERQRAQLSKLLQRFSDVSSPTEENTGRYTLSKHHIKTGDHRPVKQRAYWASPEKRSLIERQVDGLLADSYIE